MYVLMHIYVCTYVSLCLSLSLSLSQWAHYVLVGEYVEIMYCVLGLRGTRARKSRLIPTYAKPELT